MAAGNRTISMVWDATSELWALPPQVPYLRQG